MATPNRTTFRPDMAARMLQRLAVVESEMRALLSRSGTAAPEPMGGGEVTDLKDLAAEHEADAVGQAQATHALRELERIARARQRIDDGAYGQCLACGEPIDLRRLQSVPTAELCTDCQRAHERHAGAGA